MSSETVTLDKEKLRNELRWIIFVVNYNNTHHPPDVREQLLDKYLNQFCEVCSP